MSLATNSDQVISLGTFLDDLSFDLVPASDYTIEELTYAYNQTRVDYIVPMPMNAARLREYVRIYDVDVERSVVALGKDRILGLAMLGVRPGHTWVTRLGVVPDARRSGAGEAMMRYLVSQSLHLGVDAMVLDVIKNNKPAHRLFHKLGFEDIRELLILRRPPGAPVQTVKDYTVTLFGEEQALDLLKRRRSTSSWLDEYASLKNAGNLLALTVTLEEGGSGWLVYQSTSFQLGRLVPQVEEGDPYEVARALAHALHANHPAQDTKTENVPVDAPHLQGFLDMGYLEAFGRIEMHLNF